MTAPALSGVVGAPLSGYLLDHHPASLAGWQWLFLIEGLPSVALGLLVLVLLPNGPEQAAFLSPSEVAWLGARLRAGRVVREREHTLGLWQALRHPRVLLLGLVYFLLVMGAYGFDLFMPKIFARVFSTVTKTELGLLAAVPSLYTVFVMIYWGWRSDRRGERRFHVAWPAFWAAVGLWMASLDVSPAFALAAAALAVSGRWSCIPPFWGLPTAFLSGSAAAGGIALINAVGNLGGFLGPMLMGMLRDETGSYAVGLRALAGAYVLGGLLTLALGRAEKRTR
jgi:ACS family tartrate transporter-like MFS transporter